MDFHISLAIGSGDCYREKDEEGWLGQLGFVLMVCWFHLVKAY